MFHTSATVASKLMLTGFIVSFALRAPGRSSGHHALNDLLARSVASAGVCHQRAGRVIRDGRE